MDHDHDSRLIPPQNLCHPGSLLKTIPFKNDLRSLPVRPRKQRAELNQKSFDHVPRRSWCGSAFYLPVFRKCSTPKFESTRVKLANVLYPLLTFCLSHSCHRRSHTTCHRIVWYFLKNYCNLSSNCYGCCRRLDHLFECKIIINSDTKWRIPKRNYHEKEPTTIS